MKYWKVAATLAVVGLSAGSALAQSGNATRGQRVFNLQCRACHTLEKGGAHLPTGPNLHGVFGRKAGTVEGYEFSDAMKASDIIWDDTAMAEYNRDPKAKVPGTKMMFNGVKQASQLADLVAYLKQATQ